MMDSTMQFEAGNWYHIYNRGNNRKRIFFERDNYLFFLQKVRYHWLDHCKIIAYCLIPNHFHFLVATSNHLRDTSLNKAIGVTLRSYTRAVNKRLSRTGSLFQQRTKAKCLNSPGDLKSADGLDYALICFHYIHQNPFKAGLVQAMGEWEFSSYPDFAGLRNGTLPAKDYVYEWLGLNKETEFIKVSQQALAPDLVAACF